MKLGLIFTLGVSVEAWYKRGLLDREKMLYEKLLEKAKVKKIYWFTYGAEDRRYQYMLKNNIEIIPMPKIFNNKIGKLFYSFLMPSLKREYFKTLTFIKTNQMQGGWSAVIAAILYKKPLIARAGYVWSIFAKNSGYAGKLDRFSCIVERFIYRFANVVITTSGVQERYIIQTYNVNVKEVFVVPNYIDTDKFRPLDDIDKIPNKIVYVGRLEKQKNLESLIRALDNSPYGIDIYGNGTLRNRLGHLVKMLNVSVNFMGSVPNNELPRILNKYSLFALVSLYEGMPKALLEAMACGLAVLGANVKGINEVIKHGENGWLVEKADGANIRSSIIGLMQNKQLRKTLGFMARKYVEENFSLDKVAEKELEIYNTVN